MLICKVVLNTKKVSTTLFKLFMRIKSWNSLRRKASENKCHCPEHRIFDNLLTVTLVIIPKAPQKKKHNEAFLNLDKTATELYYCFLFY